MKPKILLILGIALWISAITMFAFGMTVGSLSFLKLVAIPDAVGAVIFTVLAARKWVRGGSDRSGGG